jgi:Sulfotransferase family
MNKRKADFFALLGRIAGRDAAPPIFVVGTGRCGSSLLLKIMTSHHQIAAYPDEANEIWHPHSYPFRDRKISTPAIIEDPARFTELSLANWPAGYNNYVRRLFRGYAARHSAGRRLLVKSAMISFMLPHLHALFPSAHFVHIYRYGPSVVASFLKKDWHKYKGYLPNEEAYRRHCAAYWNACIGEIDRAVAAQRLRDKGLYSEVSYEALCANPRQRLAELAKGLGLAPDGYNYDLAHVQDRNFKVGDVHDNLRWREALKLMGPGLTSKQYLR